MSRPTFHVSGTASVFEATLVVQTVRNGKSDRAEDGDRLRRRARPRDVRRDDARDARPLIVRAFSPSAEDGSPQHEVDVRVVVTP